MSVKDFSRLQKAKNGKKWKKMKKWKKAFGGQGCEIGNAFVEMKKMETKEIDLRKKKTEKLKNWKLKK